MAKNVKENIEEIQVSHPDHYNQGGIECIDALRAALGPEGFKGFCAGNVMKYVWRYQHKNGVKDCEKARFYLEYLIDELKEKS